jgi:hypothetical protein
MSFTSLSTVKKHLLSSGFGPLTLADYPVQLCAQTDVELPHHNLVEGSDVVKWRIEITPEVEGPFVLTGEDWVALSSGNLVPHETVVSTSPTARAIYSDELDYQVDCAQGRVHRLASGGIPDSQTVWVFSTRYAIFQRDSDYHLDSARGLVHRLTDGAIPDGAHVLVDYTVTAGSVTDELIQQAIAETDDLIVRTLSTAYNSSSTDPGLQTGQTELVMAIVARDLAVEVLSRRTSTEAAARAKEWQNLSVLYENRAWQTLRPFLDPYASHSPEKIARA